MILRLMRKDLLLNRSMVALVAAGLVLMVVLVNFAAANERSASLPVELLVFIGTCYPALLVSLFAGRDDRYRTAVFDLALPVTRGMVLLARYLLALLLHPVWLLAIAAVCWAWRWPRFPSAVFAPESLALSLAAFVSAMGTTYPLVTRAGFVGMLYGLVGLQAVGVAVYALGRRWPVFGSLVDAFARIGPGLRGLHARLGDPWYLLGVFAVLAALYGLSFLAAAAVYRRKGGVRS